MNFMTAEQVPESKQISYHKIKEFDAEAEEF